MPPGTTTVVVGASILFLNAKCEHMQQVAFGQMIACDDPEVSGARALCCWNHSLTHAMQCVFEWFHYQCVGLTPSTRPKATNEWFCPDCTARHRLA